MDPVERRLCRLLERLSRHLQVRSGPEMNLSEFDEGFAVAWSGDDSHVVLASAGARLLDEIHELVRATQGPSMRWQPDTLRRIADEAVQRLARHELSPQEAAAKVCSYHAQPAAERAVLINVHGLSIEQALDLCGITFYPAQLRPILQDEIFDQPVHELVIRPIAHAKARPTDAVAVVRVQADDGMAALSARLRILVALCVLRQSLRTQDSIEQQQEYTAGIERTEHTQFLEGVAGTTPQTYTWGDIRPQPLRHDAAGLARARERSGIRALEELAITLPGVAEGSRVERVLRATQLLGRSLDGDADDRFLRRWSAMEALVGSPARNTTAEVAARAAWLLESTATRAGREQWLKDLYRRRSQLSHGAVDRTPFDFDAVAFGCLCFDLLERVAARTDAHDIAALYTEVSGTGT